MTTHQPLEAWGWNGEVAARFAMTHPPPGAAPARVIAQDRDRWVMQTDTGSQMARITGNQLGGLFPVASDRQMEAQAAAVARHKTALKTMMYHLKRQGP